MTQPAENYDDFFEGAGEKGAPGYDFGKSTNGGEAKVGAGIIGTITKMHKTVVTEPGKERKVKTYPDGTEIPQLNITIQTELRGWAGVSPKSIPVDPETKQPLGPEHDNGERRLFVKYQMRQAVAEAFRKVGAPGPRIGGKIGVKLIGFRDVGQANGLPQYEAVYTAPVETDAAFADFGGQQAAPAQQDPFAGAQQAPVQQAPVQQQAPQQVQQPVAQAQAPVQQQAAPQGWGSAPAYDEPPF